MITNLITPTRNKQKALNLLARWVARFHLRFGINWIVVTDGDTNDMPCLARVIRREGDVYLDHQGQHVCDAIPGLHSMLNNLSAGLAIAAEGRPTLILEDDEWYSPDYVSFMERGLNTQDIFGIAPSHYVDLSNMSYRCMHNVSFCSLAATGFHWKVVPFIRSLIARGSPFIDGMLWDEYPGSKRIHEDNRNPCRNVSFKGIPGCEGIGISHREHLGSRDPKMTQARKLMPRDDLESYLQLK